jgi:hypothetical protein
MSGAARRRQPPITIRSAKAAARLCLLTRDGRSQSEVIEDALERMPLPALVSSAEERVARIRPSSPPSVVSAFPWDEVMHLQRPLPDGTLKIVGIGARQDDVVPMWCRGRRRSRVDRLCRLLQASGDLSHLIRHPGRKPALAGWRAGTQEAKGDSLAASGAGRRNLGRGLLGPGSADCKSNPSSGMTECS